MADAGSMHPGQAAGALQPQALVVLSVWVCVIDSTYAANVGLARSPCLALQHPAFGPMHGLYQNLCQSSGQELWPRPLMHMHEQQT